MNSYRADSALMERDKSAQNNYHLCSLWSNEHLKHSSSLLQAAESHSIGSCGNIRVRFFLFYFASLPDRIVSLQRQLSRERQREVHFHCSLTLIRHFFWGNRRPWIVGDWFDYRIEKLQHLTPSWGWHLDDAERDAWSSKEKNRKLTVLHWTYRGADTGTWLFHV